MKYTAIRQAVAKQLGWRRVSRKLGSCARRGRAITAGTLVLAGGMTFLGSAPVTFADTELLLNGSFEQNDGFNGNNVGFSWVSGNAGGSVNATPDPDEVAVFDVYSHDTQQYGGFDPDTILGGNTAGDFYFHTVGVNGLQADGTTVESPIVQQTVDLTSRPGGEDFFSLSGLVSGFGLDTAIVELTFWNAAGGIGGAGSQLGSTYSLDGTLPNSTASNLNGTAWTNNAWSDYLLGDAIPAGAVSATVQILQATTGGGNQNDNYVDLLSLQSLTSLPGDAALRITINRDNGEISLTNGQIAAQAIQGYSILSSAGALVEGNWDSVADNYDASGSGQVDGTNEWIEFTASGASGDLSEGTLGTGSISPGTTVSLGAGAWQQYFEENDIRFEYLDGTGTLQAGIVEFTGTTQTTPFDEGDLDFDGDIDGLDWTAYVANLGKTFAAQSDVEAYLDGDFNNDGANNHIDFLTFKGLFEAANPLQSFEAMVASVPEPTAVVLAMLGFVGFTGLVHRRGK